MTDEITGADARAAWQNQPREENMFAARIVQAGVRDFTREFQWVNWLNYAGVLMALAGCGFAESLLALVGFALIFVSCVVATCDLYMRGKPKPMPSGIALADTVAFLKSELERRRDLYRKQWWYVAPVVAGLVLVIAGLAINPLAKAAQSILAAAFALFCYWLTIEVFFARRVQKKIDALPRIEEL
jgi:hypothetical protein